MSSPLKYIYSQLVFTPPYPTKQFTGQTIIVTGANCGLGLEASRHFVRLDADKVILAVRSLEKGEAAQKSIELSEKKTGIIEVWQLDLASYDSVKRFAKRAESLSRLDVMVQNAGIVTRKYTTTEDNESSLTTNVISPFLLGLLILPKLRETAIKFNVLPRLVFVASFVHFLTQFPEQKAENIFETLNNQETADMMDRYNVSKLLDIFATRELAALATASPKPGRVVINCQNPGWCTTEIIREWSGLKLLTFKAARAIFARTTEVGSRTLINAAEGGEETHGQYMDDCQIGKVSTLVSSDEGAKLQKKVWAELAQKLEKIQPGIMQNI